MIWIQLIILPLIVFSAIMSVVPLLVIAERRICALIQNRIGPNRVGPQGLLQPLADVIKLVLKEEILPAGIEKGLYLLAPALVMVPAAFAFATIPVGRGLQVADINAGVLFVVTVTSLGVYGISFGGWSSNNKFSLLGGIRSNAQAISYEIAMGLAMLAVIMVSGTLRFHGDGVQPGIIDQQLGILHWNIWKQPVAFLVFLVAAFAENNRLPFDLPECESELVGGYHTEYAGMKFGMFFLGEYVAMITMSALLVSLFLGGWDPGFPLPDGWIGTSLSVVCFTVKVSFMLFFYMWVRWTLPRFRYDQLMRLGWKILIPISLVNIVVTALVILLVNRAST